MRISLSILGVLLLLAVLPTPGTAENGAPAPVDFTYDRAERRDPFKSFLEAAWETAKQSQLNQPLREKEPLEAFELDNLILVGTLLLERRKLAMIQDPTGRGYSLTIGAYMGKHDGRIIDILPGAVALEERYHHPFKGFEVRKTVLQMKSEKNQ